MTNPWDRQEDGREEFVVKDEAAGTGEEVATVDEATGAAEVLPSWLTLRGKGEEPPPLTRPW